EKNTVIEDQQADLLMLKDKLDKQEAVLLTEKNTLEVEGTELANLEASIREDMERVEEEANNVEETNTEETVIAINQTELTEENAEEVVNNNQDNDSSHNGVNESTNNTSNTNNSNNIENDDTQTNTTSKPKD